MTTLATPPSPGTCARTYAPRPWNADHPPGRALEQQLAPEHLARRIDQAVTQLDRRPLDAAYGRTGSRPHDPADLLRVVLFEVERGQHSPAVWWRDSQESGPVRWLLRGAVPSRSCWYALRQRLGLVLDELNRQVLHQAVAEELTPASRGALDGTLVAANASRHRLVNAATLTKRLAQLAAVRTPATDPTVPAAGAAAETDSPPPGPSAAGAGAVGATSTGPPPVPPGPPGWMAATPTGQQQQQQRWQDAQHHLAARQQRNQAKPTDKRTPPAKVVISLSDPEAAVGRDQQGVFRPLYKVQILDDLDSPLILSYGVCAQTNDAGLLGPMLQRQQTLVGRRVQDLLADAGYAGGPDLAVAAAAGVTVYAPWQSNDYSPAEKRPAKQLPKSAFQWQAETKTYVCPQGHALVYEKQSREGRATAAPVVVATYRCPAEHCRACPLAAQCAQHPEKGRTVTRGEHDDLVEALRARMATPEAQALYRRRRQSVELVNADWKDHRRLRRFSGRGLQQAATQVGVGVLVHNLLTLQSERRQAASAKVTAPAADNQTPDQDTT